MAAKTFESVEVWKKAHVWVLAVYRFTEKFPKHEMETVAKKLTYFELCSGLVKTGEGG